MAQVRGGVECLVWRDRVGRVGVGFVGGLNKVLGVEETGMKGVGYQLSG